MQERKVVRLIKAGLRKLIFDDTQNIIQWDCMSTGEKTDIHGCMELREKKRGECRECLLGLN